MTKAELLTLHVLDWAENRGLLKPEFAETQYLKFLEEVGETCRAILKQDKPEIIDGFGDIAVTIIILNNQIQSVSQLLIYNTNTTFDWTFGDLVRRVQPYFINPMAFECLNVLAKNQGLILEDCIESAYNQIKNRQGKIINGTFVKEVNND